MKVFRLALGFLICLAGCSPVAERSGQASPTIKLRNAFRDKAGEWLGFREPAAQTTEQLAEILERRLGGVGTDRASVIESIASLREKLPEPLESTFDADTGWLRVYYRKKNVGTVSLEWLVVFDGHTKLFDVRCVETYDFSKS